MANIDIQYKGLTGLLHDLTIDNGQTMSQLRTAIIADEGLTAGFYGLVSIHKNGTVKDSTNQTGVTLDNAGIVADDVITVATARQADKEAYQVMTLEIAQAKRSVAGQPYSRALDTYDRDILPTQYNGDTVVDNTGDGGNLTVSRPWT